MVHRVYEDRAMPEVASSAISHIAYQKTLQRLYVTYRGSQGTYVYLNVPESVYDELMKAESKGLFVNEAIKPHYKYQRLEDA
jgi:hypothetical protein